MEEPTPDNDTNYLVEMIGHPVSLSGLFASVICGAGLAVGIGVGAAAIPMVAWAGVQAVGALFLPSSPVFREWVDRRKRFERREELRGQLLKKIRAKAAAFPIESDVWLPGALDQYERMRERLATLSNAAAATHAKISTYDVERLEDATIDFLRLVFSRLVLKERMDGAGTAEVRSQLRAVREQLCSVDSAVEKRRLTQAQADLERLLERRNALPAQDAATAAQLLTMSEAFEDVYQRVTSQGGPADVGEFLREATERLSIEEELAMSVDDEIDALTRRSRAARQRQVQ
jgi:hypothetical protein